MKKRKIEYSMTAKQRKEMQKKATTPAVEEVAVQETTEQEVVTKSPSKLIRNIIVSIACLVAVCMFVTAIALPYIRPEKIEGNPIAVIKLKDGSTIKMELYIEDAPGAVANFIYLANSKFFNGTAIHDITNGFVSFSGYMATNGGPSDHKAKDESFVSSLKGFTDHTENKYDTTGFKLGYRIKRENTSATINQKGLLVFLSGTSTWGTSTHFMMTANTSPQLHFPGNSSSISTNYTVMGHYIGDESLATIERIYGMDKSDVAIVNSFRYPKAYKSITISSISIKNISRKYKKNLMKNFETYLGEDLEKLTTWNKKAFSYNESPIVI